MKRVMMTEFKFVECIIMALKAPFGCLRLPLTAESKRRYRIISICIHMFNFKTRTIGLNQIWTVHSDKDTEVQPCIQRLVDEKYGPG